jgi:hypothetical protein
MPWKEEGGELEKRREGENQNDQIVMQLSLPKPVAKETRRKENYWDESRIMRVHSEAVEAQSEHPHCQRK